MTMRDYMKSIKEGLFGSQEQQMRNRYRQKETPPVERPITMIVEDLCAFEDIEWAKYAFSREPLNAKFDDTAKIELTAKAIECGVQTAKDCMEKYGCDNPEDLAGKLGLKVDFPEMPQNAARVIFAEFREPNQVFIYLDGVRKGNQLLLDPNLKEAFGGAFHITSILLAHEIFHYVERQQKKDIWTQNYRIDLWAPPLLKNRSKVIILSEIAAMAFTKTLAQMNFFPFVLDAFMVYGYSPLAASALYEEMMELSGKTPRLPE